jgi:GGDEF domain-containing protein
VADDDADSVLANADRALYAAKAAGRGRWLLARSG